MHYIVHVINLIGNIYMYELCVHVSKSRVLPVHLCWC